MKVWMTEQVKQNKKYAFRELAILVAELGGSIAVFAGVSAFLNIKKWDDDSRISVIVMAMVTIALFLFAWISSRRSNNTLIFCRDNEWRLFALDLERLEKHCQTLGGTAIQKVVIGQKLKRLKNSNTLEKVMETPNSLKPLAPEILEVLRIRQRGNCWKLFCKVRTLEGKIEVYPYTIWHGYEDEESLLNELERHQTLRADGTAKSYMGYWFGLILSFLALILEWVLLFLSMPAVAILPDWLFLFCIGTYIIPLIAAVYFWRNW
ncbi:hypothetical protein AGATL06_19850 [Agathobaculum sp. TL06]